jgi:hypothetical protein
VLISFQPNGPLPSLNQGFGDNRLSIDAGSHFESRRSSVDSRMNVGMGHLQISPSSPYDSQNTSRVSLVCSNSEGSPTPMHESMALLHCHHRSAIAVSVLINLLVGPLSSTRILEAYRACQIQWLLLLRKVTLGPFLPSLSPTKGGHQAVVSLAQSTQTFRHARTALPHPSIVASIMQIRIFPLDRSAWTTARTPDR